MMGDTEAIVILALAFLAFAAFAMWNLRDRPARNWPPLSTPEDVEKFLRIYKQCEEEEAGKNG